MSNFETQYLGVMRQILEQGVDRPDRTGVGSRAIWGCNMEIDLSLGFPIVTTRKTSPKIAYRENWKFLNGDCDMSDLSIWKGNTSREFLDKRGLPYLPVGHIGKGYGFQWRNFGGEFAMLPEYVREGDQTISPYMFDYTRLGDFGIDQVVQVLEGLKNDPNGRRHIITGWNPIQLNEMALPPCHLYQQYQVLDGKLNSMFLMRSWDFLYGAPFNIMGYAMLNMAFAKYLGLQPGKLLAMGCDVHLYENQLAVAAQQVEREPLPLPTMTITKELNTMEDVFTMKWSDFKLEGYEAHPDFEDKPEMAV